jgi:hypothetical protein
MKTYKTALTDSITAAVDLVKHRFIGFDGNYCGADAKALGVSETDTKAGQQCPVIVYGIALVEAGGAISKGQAVKSDANGKAVAATNFSVSVPAGATTVTSDAAQPDLVEAGGVLPEAVNGYALDDAAGAGEIIRVVLR